MLDHLNRPQAWKFWERLTASSELCSIVWRRICGQVSRIEELWFIYKPCLEQNFFQGPSHLPGLQTKAEEGGGGSSSLSCWRRTGPFVRDMTSFTMKQQKYIQSRKKRRWCLSLRRSHPLFFLIRGKMFPPLYSSSHCKLRNSKLSMCRFYLFTLNIQHMLFKYCRFNFLFPIDFQNCFPADFVLVKEEQQVNH